MEKKLAKLYGDEKAREVKKEIEQLLGAFKSSIATKTGKWSEADVALITYPDAFQESSAPSLQALSQLLTDELSGIFSIQHILPFLPFSADRGFAVKDYSHVNADFGSWNNIRSLASKNRLMSDLILNHISVKHMWFQQFLAGYAAYEDCFIWYPEDKVPWNDLKKVTRPRPTPVLTPFETAKGRRYVWTTYSTSNGADQVDLNYKNPTVFVEMVRVMLRLLENGIQVLRFDGAPALWKEVGTTCYHLPQTHTLISLFREIAQKVNPAALCIAEAATASREVNETYFGNGHNEAHMIYNYPLAPLVLHSLYTSNAEKLSAWAATLRVRSKDTTFLNALDIHDGINVTSIDGILSMKERSELFDTVKNKGGQFSYRTLPDGSKVVKELNITWWSAVNGGEDDTFDMQLRRFTTSRAIAMSLMGIPAIYYLSLFGEENDVAGFEANKMPRDINRKNYNLVELEGKLQDASSKEKRVLNEITSLITRRKSILQFHPNAPQKVIDLDKRVFALLRGDAGRELLALHNISDQTVTVLYKNATYKLKPYGFIWSTL